MLKDHLLLARAHRFPLIPSTVGEGWQYRRELGAWVETAAPDSLMVSWTAGTIGKQPNPQPNPQPRPQPRPMPTSKKADVETGEDMKGA